MTEKNSAVDELFQKLDQRVTPYQEAERKNADVEDGYNNYSLTEEEYRAFVARYRRLSGQARKMVSVLSGSYRGMAEEDWRAIMVKVLKLGPSYADKVDEVTNGIDKECLGSELVSLGRPHWYVAKFDKDEKVTKVVDIQEGKPGRHLNPVNYSAMRRFFHSQK